MAGRARRGHAAFASNPGFGTELIYLRVARVLPVPSHSCSRLPRRGIIVGRVGAPLAVQVTSHGASLLELLGNQLIIR
eukprot:3213185-Pyramimonas_sp.AAC.1